MKLHKYTPVGLAMVGLALDAHGQGLIVSRQQGIDTGAPLPIAIDAGRMALERDTFELAGGAWQDSGPLIGTTLAVAADAGRFVTGNRLRSLAGNSGSGVARVQSWSANGWNLDDTLVPSDLRPGLAFGTEVEISGSAAAVLAPGWRPTGQPAQDAIGAVYVFRDTGAGWVEEALLSPASGGRFMESLASGEIALDGDTLAVAGRSSSGTGSLPAVHVLQRTGGTWSQVAELLFPSGASNGGFYLAVQEDTPGSSATIVVRGATVSQVFTGHGPNWQASDLAPGTTGPVALSGSLLALAARYDGVPGAGQAGSVRLFQRDATGTWVYRRRVFSSDPQAFHRFGEDLDFDGEWLAVGSRGQGSTYPLDLTVELFRVLPIPAGEFCSGIANSTGSVARIASSGSASVAENELELVAGPVPSPSGIFYYGSTQLQVPFGDGFRCVGSTMGIHRLQGNGAHGLLSHQLDIGSSPILPGSTWNFQAWYRDPAAGGAGFNLSTGLELTFTP